MSTILDALRKVQRERESPREQLLHVEDEALPRPRSSLAVLVVCGALAFGAGAALALYRRPPAEEVAALPPLPAPPAIAVPRPPVAARKVAPPEIAPKPGGNAEVAAGVPAVATQPGTEMPPVAGAPAGADVAPAESAGAEPPPPLPGAAPSNDQGAREIASAPAAPPQVASVPAAPPETAGSAHDLAGARVQGSPQGSAVESSPFGSGREAIAPRETAPAAPPAVVASVPRPEAVPPPADAPAAEPEALAAVPPPAGAEAPQETEPEPERPHETTLDTGRSPTGAPKVTLSFLQWSADPARRFAFISIDGAPTQRVQEGDSTAGMTIAQITQHGVQLRRENVLFTIRPRH